jgi:hypothetical protein
LFTRCLVCHTPFPTNEELGHYSNGTRIAYDPARGRLWSVCRSCKRWSLAPIEERWEALEEIEKLVTDRAKLLSQTDNIALLRAGQLDIVRVGRANLTEEAWWRYGRELTARRERHKKVMFIGTAAAGAAMAGGWITGGSAWLVAWFLWDNAPEKVADFARWMRFGSTAWYGHEACQACGFVFSTIGYEQRAGLILLPDQENSSLGVALRCPKCGGYRAKARTQLGEGGLHLTGREGEQTVRRVLAYHHHAGATEKKVRSATRLIEEAGSAQDLSRIVVKQGRRLGDLQRTGAIALEIAANEAAEQRLLELEVSSLEAHWRAEEELASIIDGELTPLPLLENLRRKATGQV